MNVNLPVHLQPFIYGSIVLVYDLYIHIWYIAEGTMMWCAKGMWCVRSWHCGIALKSANVSWCPGIAQLDYMTYLNCSNFIMLYEVWQVWFYFDNMFFFFFSWRELEVVNNKESTQLKAQLFRFNSKFLKRKKKEKRKNYSLPMSKVQ